MDIYKNQNLNFRQTKKPVNMLTPKFLWYKKCIKCNFIMHYISKLRFNCLRCTGDEAFLKIDIIVQFIEHETSKNSPTAVGYRKFSSYKSFKDEVFQHTFIFQVYRFNGLNCF